MSALDVVATARSTPAASSASGYANALEMVQEGAEELRLPVFVVADGRVQLLGALARHERREERHDRPRTLHVDEEVRPREAEHHRQLVGGRRVRVVPPLAG